MSRGFIIGAGGEGIPVHAAVLHVSAPFGSTVSIAKGGVTVKSLGPGRAHTNTDGLNADYYFFIASANYGTWSVTATRENEADSASVTIDSNRQYDVKMSYLLYAWKFGGDYIQAYWGTANITHPAYTTVGDTIVGVSPSSGYQWTVVWPNAFSASRKLSKIYLDAKIDATLYQGMDYRLKFGVSAENSALSAASTKCIAYKDVNAVADRQTYELDVSTVTNGYLFVGGVGSMTVYNMWGAK